MGKDSHSEVVQRVQGQSAFAIPQQCPIDFILMLVKEAIIAVPEDHITLEDYEIKDGMGELPQSSLAHSLKYLPEKIEKNDYWRPGALLQLRSPNS